MRVTGETSASGLHLFLATKIVPPRVPVDLIARPRLAGLAERAANKRLTVIKAPAGFGKTSLALSWLDRLRANGALVAWLSLDTEDDDPARFLNYLAHALRHACDKVGAAAISLTADAAFVPLHAVVSTLVNELVEVDDEVVLFLDDYHQVSLPAVHDAMSFLIEKAPPHVHVILCSRTDPPLPLARLRAGDDLLEIDGSVLRFDFDETRRFVERTLPGTLNASYIQTLFAGTEGWAAALRIQMSMLSRKDGEAVRERDAPSGTSRPFAAYIEYMFERLSPDMVRFMLRTSILDRLSASLCEAVTGLRASQPMLDEIAGGQLLLQALDSNGQWFRYHPLMSEYLRAQLEAQHADEVAELHCRACAWYADQELWTEAVKHAIAAGSTDNAIRLMERCAMALVKKGDLLTLLDLQRRFPAGLAGAQVKVTLAIAWGMALAMHFEEALAMQDVVEHNLASDTGAEAKDIRRECQAIRSVVAGLQDDPERALVIAEPCIERPTTDIWTTNVASNVVRFAHWKAGNLEALYATPWMAYSAEENRRNLYSSVYRQCLLGHAEMQQLHFGLAERYFTESMQLAERHAGPDSISVALCAPMIGQIWYEQGRLDKAETLVAGLMPVIDVAVLLDSVLIAYRLLIRIAAARSDVRRAYALLDRAQALSCERQWDRMTAAALVERTRLYLAESRMVEAAACVAQLDQMADSNAHPSRSISLEIENYRAFGAAAVAAAQQRTEEATAVLGAALQSAERQHADFQAIRLRTMLALIWLAASERARAIRIFREVLKVAAPAGVYQSILDVGPDIGLLLDAVREDIRHTGNAEQTAHSNELSAYVDHLLDGARILYQPGGHRRRDIERGSLSSREREIVDLIARGRSNKEIANVLGIGAETVKSHLKSVFVKLGVDKRAQAVARARDLGLVGSD
ncbi:LuxR family transcriptional regulator [Paraburkholderia madseniana]|uniref:LuxR family transcriptional regulator n=1 Tax=Paraburkholderia madseniana TaxID=2599607 RepID=A0A6N6WHG2_9BURK|nr:LuxR C-terminal-related transcriptional regulator [Paraburkholderia madseniana]KAE8759913.1 LuxR family transcriptional regulator [Paraburkholderia madseniana]